VLCGLGFGVAIAPTNAALLAGTDDAVHGLASALLVVARMVGMLVGISALTAIGLHRFYAVSATQPSLHETCPHDNLCAAYVDALKQAGIAQMHAIFWSAAVAAAVAGALSLLLLPTRRDVRRG
jgi:membrane associated rhomboid family serine protease